MKSHPATAADSAELFAPFLEECRRAFRQLHGLPPIPGKCSPPALSADLLPLARRHRMVGLLHAVGAADAPPAWRNAAYGQALHSARLAAEAERLYERLAPAVKGLLLVKGPALAAQAWPDPGLRAFDDLDWRCEPADGPALEAALRAAGYRPEIADDRRRGHYWHFGWGVAFVGPAAVRAEINFRFFPPHWPWPPFRAGGAPVVGAEVRLDRGVVRAPTPEEHLALACGHALWHGGARLAWAADIAGLLARHPGCHERARAGLLRPAFPRAALDAGCFLAEQLFGPGLCRIADPRGVYARIVSLYRAQLAPPGEPTATEARRLHRKLMTRVEWARSALLRALAPGDGDFRRFNLPPCWRALYWPLRPFRAVFR